MSDKQQSSGDMYAWRAWQSDPGDPALLQAYIDSLGADDTSEAEHARALHRPHVDNAISKLPRWRDGFPSPPAEPSPYLDLLEKVVCNWIYRDANITLSERRPFEIDRRLKGQDTPEFGHSMIGRARLAHLRWAVEKLLADGVPGDLLEAGVWRGGACILMRGVLKAHGVKDRAVLVADSFEGLPPPDPRHPEDALSTFDFHLRPELSVSLEEVRGNFARYDLLDDQVVFVRGFFAESLPPLSGRPLALLRLDGDLFSSTMDTLEALYDAVQPGGMIIVDDYGTVIDARRAVAEFRTRRGVSQQLYAIDDDGVFWIK